MARSHVHSTFTRDYRFPRSALPAGRYRSYLKNPLSFSFRHARRLALSRRARADTTSVRTCFVARVTALGTYGQISTKSDAGGVLTVICRYIPSLVKIGQQ
jgi:hypothetical protein